MTTVNPYDSRYGGDDYYWGLKPSSVAIQLLKLLPPRPDLRVIDIGCGEGRNAVFLARSGYDVSAFDLSTAGLDKARRLADESGVVLDLFRADIREYRLDRSYDIIFSTGTLQYVPKEQRQEIITNYKTFTNMNGLNTFSILLAKPFISPAPDADATARLWRSGEIFTLYHDWKLEHCEETVFDCISSGVPHQHAVNRMIARKL